MRTRITPGAEEFRFDAGPSGALLIHGFTGCPASMRPLGEWLADHGVSSSGPRMPGHGTTWQDLDGTTWKDWEREVERALADLRTRCQDVVVVGLSMGGAMAIHIAANHAKELRGIAVINGLVRRPELALVPIIRLFTRSVKGVGNDIKKQGQDEIVYDRVPLRAVVQMGKLIRTADAELPSLTLPLLVFSSPEDHTVKPENSRRILERAGSSEKELVTLSNSYHVATLDHDAPMIFERILEFVGSTAVTAPPTTPG